MSLFNPRVKKPLHVVYIILVVAAMGLSVPRLFMKGQPRTRANTIALGMVCLPWSTPYPNGREIDTDTGSKIAHVHCVPDLHRARSSSSPLAKLQSLLDPERSRSRVLGGGGLPCHAGQPCSMCWSWL